MTRDEIIRMARQAHMHHLTWDADYIEGTERFAALVAEHEREACAKVCENGVQSWSYPGSIREECAAAIRARGQA